MFEGAAWIDGRLMKAAEATVSVFDRGFSAGDSAFTLIRSYGGRLFRLAPHLERLYDSCGRLFIVPPLPMEELAGVVDRTVEAAALDGDCFAYVSVTRGVAPLGISITEATSPSVIVLAVPQPPRTEFSDTGIAAALTRVARSTEGRRAAGAKTGNYLDATLALHEVKEQGFQEALIVGPAGEVLEGATSNVFTVRMGEVLTPPADAGLLAGVTREAVMEVAAGLGLTVRETPLHAPDVRGADEVFLTSTMREVMPVVRVDDVTIGAGRPGPVTVMLRDGFQALATA